MPKKSRKIIHDQNMFKFYFKISELNENINLISMEKLDPGSPETWPEKSNLFDNLRCGDLINDD